MNWTSWKKRFEVLRAVKTQVEVFCVVMVCSGVIGYQHFRGSCCFHLQGEVPTLVSYHNTTLHHNSEDLDLNFERRVPEVFQQLTQNHWNQSVQSRGDYFERDTFNKWVWLHFYTYTQEVLECCDPPLYMDICTHALSSNTNALLFICWTQNMMSSWSVTMKFVLMITRNFNHERPSS
jgi:hypothetical protein